MSTLICFTTCRKIDWQIVYQVAYNSQLFDSQFIDSHFRITPLYEIVMMFPEDFRNFYVEALMFQPVLTSNGFCDIDIFQ